MKLPQLSLHDLFWLVLVCALGVGWGLELRARWQLESQLEQHGFYAMGSHFNPQVWKIDAPLKPGR